MTAVVSERMDFRSTSEAIGALPWMRDLRARAAKLAGDLDWPDSHAMRPWKYYDAHRIGVTPETGAAHTAVKILGPAFAVRFSEAAGPAAQVLKRHFGSAVRLETDRLTALHYAFLQDGVLVNVPENAEPTEPIRIVSKIAGAGLGGPHTLIVTGANSRITVVEEFESTDDDAAVVLPVAEVIPGPGSEVRYYVVHRWGARTKVFANQLFLGRESDGAFRNLQIVLGGEIVKGHLESSLEGRGTTSELLGLTYGTGSNQADFFTLQDHIGPDTRSDLKYKAALKDESSAIYYGLTKVGLGAKNADANQENRNLLLSKTARADSDPVLEILTSDIIRAAHGATAGPVDQEQLFYLQARGIPYDAAEDMLVHAFLEDVLSRVPDLALREELVAMLEERLDA